MVDENNFFFTKFQVIGKDIKIQTAFCVMTVSIAK